MNPTESKLWHFSVRRAMAYIQPTAKTEDGFYISIEPIEVVSIADTGAFTRALRQMLSLGNPIVPTPDRDNPPKSSLLEKAKVKSISQFQRIAQEWEITARDGIYTIGKMRRSTAYRGCWEDDPATNETLGLLTTLDEVANRVVQRVQAAK